MCGNHQTLPPRSPFLVAPVLALILLATPAMAQNDFVRGDCLGDGDNSELQECLLDVFCGEISGQPGLQPVEVVVFPARAFRWWSLQIGICHEIS